MLMRLFNTIPYVVLVVLVVLRLPVVPGRACSLHAHSHHLAAHSPLPCPPFTGPCKQPITNGSLRFATQSESETMGTMTQYRHFPQCLTKVGGHSPSGRLLNLGRYREDMSMAPAVGTVGRQRTQSQKTLSLAQG